MDMKLFWKRSTVSMNWKLLFPFALVDFEFRLSTYNNYIPNWRSNCARIRFYRDVGLLYVTVICDICYGGIHFLLFSSFHNRWQMFRIQTPCGESIFLFILELSLASSYEPQLSVTVGSKARIQYWVEWVFKCAV